MIETIQVSGKTEEEAIASALAQLGKEMDEVTIEVIERAKSGFSRYRQLSGRYKGQLRARPHKNRNR